MTVIRTLKKSKLHADSGMTILELIISLALGVVLMAGVAEVFVGMRQTDRTQEVNARMQEAGRFALDFLSQDLRTAGYLGCASTKTADQINNILAPPVPGSFQPTTGIQGWEADNTGPGDIVNSVANGATESVTNANISWDTTGGNVMDTTTLMPDTDIMRVWGLDTLVPAGTLLSITDGVTPIINISPMNIATGDILMVSDCAFVDVVQACTIANVTGPPATMNVSLGNGSPCSPGNTPSSILGSEVGAEVSKLSGTMYYIGKRGNVASNPPSLFRRTLSTSGTAGTPEELVEGIESLQLLYGENTNNDFRNTADRYVTADLVSDWTKVVSVRMSILVQSVDDNLTPNPQPYTFNGVIYDGESGNGNLPADNRVRRVFSSTINLRNRTLGGS